MTGVARVLPADAWRRLFWTLWVGKRYAASIAALVGWMLCLASAPVNAAELKFTCAQCMPSDAVCDPENFAKQPLIARLSGAHFERYLSRGCMKGDPELGCSLLSAFMLYGFRNIDVVQAKAGATETEFSARYDYVAAGDPEWGGIYLRPEKIYLAAIGDTRNLLGYMSVRLACELPTEGGRE